MRWVIRDLQCFKCNIAIVVVNAIKPTNNTHNFRIDSLLGKQGMNEDRNMLYQQLTMFLAGRRVSLVTTCTSNH